MDMGRVIAIQPIYANPTQPNPWVDPTHAHVCAESAISLVELIFSETFPIQAVVSPYATEILRMRDWLRREKLTAHLLSNVTPASKCLLYNLLYM